MWKVPRTWSVRSIVITPEELSCAGLVSAAKTTTFGLRVSSIIWRAGLFWPASSDTHRRRKVITRGYRLKIKTFWAPQVSKASVLTPDLEAGFWNHDEFWHLITDLMSVRTVCNVCRRPLAGMLVLTSTPSVQVGLLKEQTLHCQFAVDHKSPDVTVEWKLQRRGERTLIFSHASRSGKSQGSGVSVRTLGTGNASLRIPLITQSNEGTYMCSVLIPPLYGSSDIILNIQGTTVTRDRTR